MFDIKTLIASLRARVRWIDVVTLGALLIAYGLTRIIHLERWPIFSDEGIYIRWAKVAWHDASWRFISVTDGRQPLQTWATIPFLKLFWPHALFAGRMFSVASGFAALCGISALSGYLWGKRAAFLSALIYLFMPYFLFYDRMALVDSAVNAGCIWIVFLSIVLARTRRIDVAYTLGFVGGMALLAKSSSRLFLLTAGTAPILFLGSPKKTFILKTVNYLILLGMAIAIGLLFYNVQRLSPFFHYVELKNTTFVMTFQEFMAAPFSQIRNNLPLIPLYIAWESGWTIVPVSIAGYALLFKKDFRLALYLLMFTIIPFLAIGFFAKVIFPRYLLFNASILTLGAVYFFHEMKSKFLTTPLLVFVLISMLFLDYPFIFNPARASLPEVDHGQYVQGVSAVWGAQELMEYMRLQSTKQKVIILAEGNFGLVADVLDVFLQDGDNIEIRGEWPLSLERMQKAQMDLKNAQIYIVFSHRDEFPSEWPMKFVKKYSKPVGDKALYLYQLTK